MCVFMEENTRPAPQRTVGSTRQTRRENALWAKMRDRNLGRYKDYLEERELTDVATAEFMQISRKRNNSGGRWALGPTQSNFGEVELLSHSGRH